MAGTVFAIGAHPDDIEFMMAGTLILLGQAGYELHYMNLADGCCGTTVYSREEAAAIRAREGRAACELIGAEYHPSLVADLEVFFEKDTMVRLGAVLREVNPAILLLQSPQDYMEDHMNTVRLGVTAAFCMGMKNFLTRPDSKPVAYDCAVYHALPYGLRDHLRRRVWPGQYVDVGPVMGRKRDMLACHRSQKEWLDKSQGLDSYLNTMEDMAREVGRMSGRFKLAEGWRRHSHLGFSPSDSDPIAEALGDRVLVDPGYEAWLERKPWG